MLWKLLIKLLQKVILHHHPRATSTRKCRSFGHIWRNYYQVYHALQLRFIGLIYRLKPKNKDQIEDNPCSIIPSLLSELSLLNGKKCKIAKHGCCYLNIGHDATFKVVGWVVGNYNCKWVQYTLSKCVHNAKYNKQDKIKNYLKAKLRQSLGLQMVSHKTGESKFLYSVES